MNSGMIKRMFFGLMLIGIGLLFLASQLGIIQVEWGEIIPTYWPVILIYIGFAGMLSSGRNGAGLFWNGFIALLGVMFLLRNLNVWVMDIGDMIKLLLPVAIILFGVKLIFQSGGKSHARPGTGGDQGAGANPVQQPSPPPPPPPPPSVFEEQEWKAEPTGDPAGFRAFHGVGGSAETQSHDGWQDQAQAPGWQGESPSSGWQQGGSGQAGGSGSSGHSCWQGRGGWTDWNGNRRDVEERNGFIGDVHLGRDYWELKPMNVNHFIGDTVIDLTKAQIPSGETRLNISAFIGDVKVLVPNDNDISFKVHSSSFIGDIRVFDRHASGFLRSVDEQLPNYADADKKIILQCNMFVGDIQIMRVG